MTFCYEMDHGMQKGLTLDVAIVGGGISGLYGGWRLRVGQLKECTKSQIEPIIPHETQTLSFRSDPYPVEKAQTPAASGQARGRPREVKSVRSATASSTLPAVAVPGG